MKPNKKKMKIELAENGKIEELREYVDEVLELIGFPEALVTDLSQVWNFTEDGQELKAIAERLGFTVDDNDYIWELAEQHRAKKWAGG
jgi:hypothetical protein